MTERKNLLLLSEPSFEETRATQSHKKKRWPPAVQKEFFEELEEAESVIRKLREDQRNRSSCAMVSKNSETVGDIETHVFTPKILTPEGQHHRRSITSIDNDNRLLRISQADFLEGHIISAQDVSKVERNGRHSLIRVHD